MRMSKERYLLLIVLASAAFIYILGTEVVTRWEESYGLYDQVCEKRKAILNPEELRARRNSLIDQNEKLSSFLTKDAKAFSQNQNGVFEFLSSNAKSTGIQFESLIPKESAPNGQSKEIVFKIDFESNYHELGQFINSIETGPFPVSIMKMEIASSAPKRQKVHVSTEGRAYLIAASAHAK